jgi:hypothetical protein
MRALIIEFSLAGLTEFGPHEWLTTLFVTYQSAARRREKGDGVTRPVS